MGPRHWKTDFFARFLQPADMIGMVVGDQNGIALQLLCIQMCDHRCGIARVHDHRVPIV